VAAPHRPPLRPPPRPNRKTKILPQLPALSRAIKKSAAEFATQVASQRERHFVEISIGPVEIFDLNAVVGVDACAVVDEQIVVSQTVIIGNDFDPRFRGPFDLAAQPFYYEPDFHNQLKARLLQEQAPIQIIRETTIAPEDFLKPNGYPVRNVDKPSVIAWNFCTTAFYKASGRPWKLASVRPGVCYLGLVFKRDERSVDSANACCAAQMFLDSGDGVVFKGAIGPWYSPTNKEFHLSSKAATEVVATAVESYKEKNSTKRAPKELFIHGRIGFSDEEWDGFKSAVDRTTKLVGVQIKRRGDLKVYSNLMYPMLRGMAHIQNQRQAYLWTIGYVPRLQTFVGKEVPNPLFVNVCRGRAPIEQVLNDILALTKLNYNTCQYGDGSPVTLKFADSVGEILTAGPVQPHSSPLPFKFYI
jgi:hypothetical protein